MSRCQLGRSLRFLVLLSGRVYVFIIFRISSLGMVYFLSEADDPVFGFFQA